MKIKQGAKIKNKLSSQNDRQVVVCTTGFSRANFCRTANSRTHHCMKIVRIRSYSGLYFLAFGLNADQNKSEYGHLLCSVP